MTSIDQNGIIHRGRGAGGGQFAGHVRTAPSGTLDSPSGRDIHTGMVNGDITVEELRSIIGGVADITASQPDLLRVAAQWHDDPVILTRIWETNGQDSSTAVSLARNPSVPGDVIDAIGGPGYPDSSVSAVAVTHPNISDGALRDAVWRGRDPLHVKAAMVGLHSRNIDPYQGTARTVPGVPYERVPVEEVRASVAGWWKDGTVIRDGVARSIAWQLASKIEGAVEIRAVSESIEFRPELLNMEALVGSRRSALGPYVATLGPRAQALAAWARSKQPSS